MTPTTAIPVIDFSRFQTEPNTLAQELVQAFRTIGFVILTDHGIPPATLRDAFGASRSFFEQSPASKQALQYETTSSNRGYIAMGLEKLDAHASDLKETFDIGYEGDTEYQNRWPDLPGFRETMLTYFEQFDSLHLQILQAIALGLGLDRDYFDAYCDGNHQNLRLLHYPECDRQLLETHKRGGIHTDYGTITLVAQNDVSGLVVQDRDGGWVGVPLIANSIVVNVGEMLQRWSNDELRATPHQVLDEVSTTQQPKPDRVPERYSIAFFCNANKETVLQKLPCCEGEAKYEPINAYEYITARLNSTIPV